MGLLFRLLWSALGRSHASDATAREDEEDEEDEEDDEDEDF
jgi:hypothetical protein